MVREFWLDTAFAVSFLLHDHVPDHGSFASRFDRVRLWVRFFSRTGRRRFSVTHVASLLQEVLTSPSVMDVAGVLA
jgi:hypothetical protein